jgi:hypothetical protein
MIDVTPTIESFAARKPGWRQERGRELGQEIASRLDGWLDWDRGAGEDWARVLVDDEDAVLICMLGPLLIVTGDNAAAVADITAELPVITVPSVHDEILACDPQTLRAAFGDRVWNNPRLNAERFSAGELWFTTV